MAHGARDRRGASFIRSCGLRLFRSRRGGRRLGLGGGLAGSGLWFCLRRFGIGLVGCGLAGRGF